jgi:hypothetical protein
MSHGERTLSHDLHQVTLAQLVAHIAAYAQGDDEPVEVATFEEVVGEGHCHAADCRPRSLPAPDPSEQRGHCLALTGRQLELEDRQILSHVDFRGGAGQGNDVDLG